MWVGVYKVVTEQGEKSYATEKTMRATPRSKTRDADGNARVLLKVFPDEKSALEYKAKLEELAKKDTAEAEKEKS